MFKFILLNYFNQTAVAAVAPYTQLLFRNKGYSHSLIGVIVAIGQIASIIIPVLIGMVSDRTRKTKYMGIAIVLLFSAVMVPTALSGSIIVSTICFFIASGLFWSLNPMFDGYVNRVLEGDSSKYGVARAIGTMGYLLFLLFCGLSGIPNETDNRSIMNVILLVCAALLVVCMISPKDVPRDESDKKEKGSSLFDFSCFSHKFLLMMFIVGLTRIPQGIIDKMLSAYMTEELNLGSRFALFYSLGALCEFLVIIFGGKLIQKGKVSAFRMIVLSTVGMIIRMWIYFFFRSVTAFAIAQTFHGLTFGALHIGITRFIADNVDEDHYSLGMSFYWAIATNLPNTIGIIAGGFIIDGLGYRALFGIYSLFAVVAIILCAIYRKSLMDNPPVLAVKEA